MGERRSSPKRNQQVTLIEPMIDPKITERISSDYWLNSPLSVARFSGVCKINGTRYVVDPRTNELVREDVFRKEQKQNARLAAQAPEMYRVIREQYDQIVADSPHKSGEWCDFYNDVINIVREVEPHLFDVEPESRPDYTGLSF